MQANLILLALLAIANFGNAQCPALSLADLQTLQRAEQYIKDSKINDLGFDLRSEFVVRGSKIRGYSKCWNSTFRQKPLFEQLIWWNTEQNSVAFYTLQEDHFKALRQSIVERRSSGNMAENPDVYVGHLFMYRFGQQKIDGIDYFMVSIQFKQ